MPVGKRRDGIKSPTSDFASLKFEASTELEVGCKVRVDGCGVGGYEWAKGDLGEV